MTAPPSLASPRIFVPFAIITLIWGSTWLVIRGQLGAVDPSWSVAYRFLIAGVVMLAYAMLTGASLKLGRDGHLFAAAIGVTQFALNFNFVYRAEQHIASGLVAVIFALLIVPNAVFGAIFLGNRFTPRFVIGSLVAIAGVALLFIHEVRVDPGATMPTLLGVGLAFAGVMCASVSNVMQASARAKVWPMASLLGWAMLWGGAMNAVYAYATAGDPTIALTWPYLAGLAYLSIAASAVAFSLYFPLIRTIGPARAAYSGVLVPIIAMLLSTIFEGYRWSLLTVAGGVLALIGMAVALAPTRPETGR